MKQLALLSLVCLLVVSHSFAQNRQAYLGNAKDNIVLNDSQLDTAGNQIGVGLEWQIGTSYSNYHPVAIKTSKNGTRIWTRALNYTGTQALKVRIAANGDYLILAKDNWPMLWRLSPSGVTVFASRYTYTNQVADYITGFAEMSNHHIAICGINDFTYGGGGGYILKSYFVHTDSVGHVVNPPGNFGINLQTYGNDHSSSGTDQFLINDVACLNNKLYFIGSYQPGIGGTRGLVITTDLNGNNPVYRITAANFTWGSGISPATSFSAISTVKGKLFVESVFASSSTQQNQFIGLLDTTSFSVTGIELHVANKLSYHAQYFIRDTANWYFAFQPSVSTSAFEVRHTLFTGRITSGALVQSRRIYQDSAIVFGGFSAAGDTLVYNGSISGPGYSAGYLASFNMAAAASTLCGVTDTAIASSACATTMSVLSSGPANSVRSLSSYGTVPQANAACIYDMHICGSVPCSSSGLASSFTTLSPTSVCPGDTVRLVRSATCNHLVVYRDTVQLADKDTLTIPTDGSGKGAGKYFIIVDNGACRDTSLAVQVRVYPAPAVPVISQQSDTLFSSAASGYQWLDSNYAVIAGATQRTYLPDESGRYYVRVTDGNGCSAVSAAFYYLPPVLNVPTVQTQTVGIYPNPTTAIFSIAQQTGAPVAISLLTQTGSIIRHWTQTDATQRYDVTNLRLAPGLYFIIVSGRNFSAGFKLVVIGG